MPSFKMGMGLVVLLLIIVALDASAQVNVEKYRKAGHQKGLTGFAKVSFSSRTGNVDVSQIDFEGNADYKWRKINSFFLVRGDQGWKDKKQYSNEALAHFRQVFSMTGALQPEVFVQSDFNKNRLLLDRKLAGIGLRGKILENSNNLIVCGSSLMYEYERLDITDESSHKRISRTGRWNNYLSFNINLGTLVRGFWTTYYQPDLNDLGDMRVLSEADLKIVVIEPISVIISFRMRYDSKPPENIKDIDTRMTTGFAYVF